MSKLLQRVVPGVALVAAGSAGGVYFERHLKAPEEQITTIVDAIGNTPLLEIKSLSNLTGCRILAKAEFMNPSGSVKDRAAKFLIEDAEASGQLQPGGIVVEATGGNTGVGLAIVAAAKGYRTIFTMPDKTSTEKIDLMKVLGAEVHVQPGVGMADPQHFYNLAKRIVASDPLCFGPDQFENIANSRAHYVGTGPEIWRQTAGHVTGFVVASGTGGTIGGVSKFLKEKNSAIQVWHIDPIEGGASSDYVAEGIGLARVTPNFKTGLIDRGIFGTNAEIIQMVYYLLRHEGLFVGPSAALNVVGAVKMARELGPGHTIVTVLCDGGDRYRSKLFNAKWLEDEKLTQYVDAPLKL
ncbi:hypothetical protein DYB36_008251 [Aphanomyces astaci]|uniref:Tryptophan synthase beta chain-like PALP domain-containing protein n=1 Tax=Aphanomyces astaci TaxID=112090 RepID=A0A397A444_APHAT|nr:hypothetical protein DYB36_008251 [Aphanomyces astaci]